MLLLEIGVIFWVIQQTISLYFVSLIIVVTKGPMDAGFRGMIKTWDFYPVPFISVQCSEVECSNIALYISTRHIVATIKIKMTSASPLLDLKCSPI